MTEERSGLSRRIAAEVADELAAARESDGGLAGADERAWARKLIADHLEVEARRRLREDGAPLSTEVEDAVAREAFARLFGLGRLQHYLDDPTVTDIHVQGCDTVWLKHTDGTRAPGEAVADSDEELIGLLRTAAARLGRTERRFDAANPELNLQLPDGSRLFAVMEVAARPSVTIRKHQFDLAYLNDLYAVGSLDDALLGFLRAAVRARQSIVIGGGIATGKTTLMRALINEIAPEERLVTVEDALELGIDRFPEQHPNVVTLEAREPNLEGQGGISLEALVRMGLRMDPDRVCLGETRGNEVLQMLLAMSQGRDGSLCTVHANTARGVFSRLAMYAMLPPHQLDPTYTAKLVANAVDLVVHLGQRTDHHGQVHRYVTEVLEVRDAADGEVAANEVFRPGPDGRATPVGALHADTRAALEAVGFDPHLLLDHDGKGPPWS